MDASRTTEKRDSRNLVARDISVMEQATILASPSCSIMFTEFVAWCYLQASLEGEGSTVLLLLFVQLSCFGSSKCLKKGSVGSAFFKKVNHMQSVVQM